MENALTAKKQLKILAEEILSLQKSANIESDPRFESFFSCNLPSLLENFVNEIKFRDPTDPVKNTENNKATDEQSASKIIFWKHNVDNNKIYIKREIESRLGQIQSSNQLDALWLDQFNIGDIMHLQPMKYSDIDPKNSLIEEILSKEYLINVVLVYACCLFSIATENRFICTALLDEKIQVKREGREAFTPACSETAKMYKLYQDPNYQ